MRRLPSPELTTCPICLAAFGTRRQACLLECSHVFHGGCLRQLLAFAAAAAGAVAGAAAGRCVTCPLCRLDSQSTRPTLLPGAAALHAAAVAVQAAVRGWLGRRRVCRAYIEALQQERRQRPVAVARRPPRLLAAALSLAAAGAIAATGRARAVGMAAALATADEALAASRSLGSAAEVSLGAHRRLQPSRSMTAAAVSQQHDDVGALLLLLGSHTISLDATIASLLASAAAGAASQLLLPSPAFGDAVAAEAAVRPLRPSAPLLATPTDAVPADWDALLAAAVARGRLRDDCAICAAPLLPAVGGEDTCCHVSWALLAPDATSATCIGSLLPCGHVLHAACIGSYERFVAAPSVAGGGVSGAAVPSQRCPLCRRGYTQRVALIPAVG